MKFRLSTIILVSMVAALAAGWLIERQRWESHYESKIKRSFDDAMIMMEFGCKHLHLNRYLFKNEQEFQIWNETELVTTVIRLFRDESEFNSAYASTEYKSVNAERMAGEILRWAKIDSHAQLITFAQEKTLYQTNIPNYNQIATSGILNPAPEIHDNASEEYEKFEKFVKRCLEKIPAGFKW